MFYLKKILHHDYVKQVAAAIVGSAVVGAVGSTVASSNSASASEQAANTQAAAAGNATAVQYGEFQQQLQMQQPWINAGQTALSALQSGQFTAPTSQGQIGNANLNQNIPGAPGLQNAPTAAQANNGQAAPVYNPLNAQTFNRTPQSLYLQQQATQAAQNQASATGMQLSGAQLQALQSNAVGLASQDYNTAFGQNLQNYNTGLNAYQQNYANANTAFTNQNQVAQQNFGNQLTSIAAQNQYAQQVLQNYNQATQQNFQNAFNSNQFNANLQQSLAGQGQTATNYAGNAAGAYGSAAASNIIGAGNAQAAGQVGAANAYGQGFSGVSNAVQNYALQNILNQNGSTGSAGASSGGYGFTSADSGLNSSNAGSYDYANSGNYGLGSALGY
jgi:hypothetical protein